MELAGIISQAASGQLQLRLDIDEPEWTFWERRTLNLHRVVALWNPLSPPRTVETLRDAARKTVSGRFKSSWWRGLGFGLVLESDRLPADQDSLAPLIDGRANSKGTWQWTIVTSKPRSVAVGVHMWMEGYLSPVYRSILGLLAATGFQTASVKCEKDGLLRALTSIADLKRMITSFGLAGPAFKEFDNRK